MPTATPALIRAESALREAAKVAAQSPGGRLPTISAIAAEAGLSCSTVWKAVSRLKEQGVLRARRGSRLTVPSALPSPPLPVEDRLRWHEVQESITRDIYSGVYPHATSRPAAKELTARYGACYATVKRALDRLVDLRTLVRHLRGYRVRPVVSGWSAGTVVLVARGRPDGTLMPIGPRAGAVRLSLERECALVGISLRTLSYDYLNGRIYRTPESRSLLAPLSGPTTVLGYVIREEGVHNPQQPDARNLASLLTRLGRLGRPLALLDEGSGLEAVPGHGSTAARVFSIECSAEAGRQVGRYLLGLGHRRIAYISAVHRSLWSVKRLAGLREAVIVPGTGGGVHAYTIDQATEPRHMIPASRNSDQSLARLLATDAGRADPLLSRAIQTLQPSIGEAVEVEYVRSALEPLLDEAMRSPEITAWVAANDVTARVCLDFLEERRMVVPQDLSVVSFDDTYSACERSLTSYNFNIEAVARASLAHVLSPRRRQRGAEDRRSVSVRGFLTVRQTAGSARKPAAQ